MIVADASLVVAALAEPGPVGSWAEGVLRDSPVAGPHLLPVEVASILRRAVALGDISADVGTMAHGDLRRLAIDLFPYEPFAERVWSLRATVTAYDAWYVAVAEALGAPLATLDMRLARAPGPRCEFVVPFSPANP